MSDLTTLEAAELYSGVTGSATDDLIQSLVTAYSQFVRTYTSRDFTAQSYSHTFDGRNARRLMVRQTPIISVEGVSVDGVAIAASAGFGMQGYRFDADTIILEGRVFTRGAANVTVSYTAGYASIPDDIAQAVNELVGLRYELADKQGWSSKSLAGETVSLITKSMPDSVRTVLDQYAAVMPA